MYNRKWTDKEIALLHKTSHLPRKTVQVLIPKRSVHAITEKRLREGITNKTKYTDIDIEMLDELSGMLPLKLITKRISQKSGVKRTELGIKAKMKKLGLSCQTEWDNLTIYRWQTLLNLTRRDFDRWTKRKDLKPKKVGKYWIVSIEQMTEVINKYPESFANSDEQLLLCYFGEEIYHKIIELKKQGLKREKKQCFKKNRIKCVKTGKEFNSQSEAAKYFNLPEYTISKKTKKGEFIKL